MSQPRLLIEEWLPAAAIGVECIRERSTGQQPPDKRLHVWWARRPLVVSRAAVLGSLLPADFPRDVFERLLGFWGTSAQIVEAQAFLDWAKAGGGERVQNPHGGRAFRRIAAKITSPGSGGLRGHEPVTSSDAAPGNSAGAGGIQSAARRRWWCSPCGPRAGAGG